MSFYTVLQSLSSFYTVLYYCIVSLQNWRVGNIPCAVISNNQPPPLQYSPVMFLQSQLYHHLTVYIEKRAVFEKFYLRSVFKQPTATVQYSLSLALSLSLRSRFLLLFLSLSLSRSLLSSFSFFFFVLCVNFSKVNCIVIVQCILSIELTFEKFYLRSDHERPTASL